jgi:biotin carboxyl carrier protein
VEVEIEGDRILLAGREVAARLEGSGALRMLVRSRTTREFAVVAADEEGGAWSLLSAGHRLDVKVLDLRALALREARRAAGGPAGAGLLRSPMPGMVVRVLVAVGDEVRSGQPLVVLEAMKMENELRAAGSGVVREVLVKAGEKVEKGGGLIEVQ